MNMTKDTITTVDCASMISRKVLRTISKHIFKAFIFDRHSRQLRGLKSICKVSYRRPPTIKSVLVNASLHLKSSFRGNNINMFLDGCAVQNSCALVRSNLSWEKKMMSQENADAEEISNDSARKKHKVTHDEVAHDDQEEPD
eukprot:g43605.t1